MSAWNEKIKDICGMLQLELHPQAVKMLTDEDEIPASAIKAGEKYGHLAYCQAQALVYSLGKDEIFAALNEAEREYVCSRILDEVKGRMLEEIVLYETMRKLPECDVFKLEFIAGEFDMVIYDRRAHSCKIFEIKHSRERVDSQYRHLINETYCRDTEQQFGTITEKTVLYRGESHDESNGIRYRNVSEYLKGL